MLRSQSGDRVYIESEVNSRHVFYHCSADIIFKNLTLEGIKGTVQPSIGCNTLSRMEHNESSVHLKYRLAPILFHFKENEIQLVNLILKSGYILAANNVLNVDNCTVQNTVIFLMDEFSFYKHSVMSKKMQAVNDFVSFLYIGYLVRENKTVIVNLPDSSRFTCLKSSLVVNNVTWAHKAFNTSEFIPVDSMASDGIQSICISLEIKVHNSFLADRPMYAVAVEKLLVLVHDSIFEGKEKGTNVLGGIDLGSFCVPYIVVKNTKFIGLKYADLAHAILAHEEDHFTTAAFRVNMFVHNVKGIELCKLCEQHSENREYHPDILIIDSTFQNNTGAIVISSILLKQKSKDICLGFNEKVLMLVTKSKFFNNEKVGNGGAVEVKFGPKLEVSIRNCLFKENKAGIIPFSTPVLITGKPIMVGAIFEDVTGYRFNGHSDVELDIAARTYGNQEPGNVTIEVGIAGFGGALYLQQGLLTITNCQFYNNSANKLGGSVFISRGTMAGFQTCQFYSDENHRNVTNGLIFYSQAAEVTLSGVQFYVGSLPPDKTAVIYQAEDVFKSGVIRITNMEITCSDNSRLILDKITKIELNWFSKNFQQYKVLQCYCVPCPEGFYTLKTGSYRTSGPTMSLPDIPLRKVTFGPPPPPPISVGVSYVHNVTHVDFPCESCPYGAQCNGALHSKLNYWGYKSRNRVKFYFCPISYCCTSRQCNKFDQCATFRSGTLCGACKKGYSEALFSVKCVPNSQCKDYWMLFVGLLLSLFYASFLLFQNDVKEFVYSAPIGKATIVSSVRGDEGSVRPAPKRTVKVDTDPNGNCENQKTQDQIKYPNQEKHDQVQMNTVSNDISHSQKETNTKPHSDSGKLKEPIMTDKTEEGGIFLILLFYYFQDASIIQVTTPYETPEDYEIKTLKKVIGGLFSFQLNILHLADSVCVFEGSTPETKIVVKLLFITTIFVFLSAAYGICKCLTSSRSDAPVNILAKKFQAKIPVAVMLAILFSFQKLAASAFSLVYCVPFERTSVLFIDGNLECYTYWQIIIVVYISISILPFCLYITFATNYLKNGKLSLSVYFIGCFVPLPVLLILFVKNNCRAKNVSDVKVKSNATRVYNLLQGPYKDYFFTLKGKKIYLCFSGVLLIRRSILIVLHTFIHNLSLRLLLMLLLCILASIIQTYARPGKERRSNAAALVSNMSLILVSCVNLIKAVFVTTEYDPTRPILTFSDALQSIEEFLLFWIPVIGIGVVFLIIIVRATLRIISKLKSC